MCDKLDNTIVYDTRSIGNGRFRKRSRLCKKCKQHIKTIELIIPKVSVGRPDKESKSDFRERLFNSIYHSIEEILG